RASSRIAIQTCDKRPHSKKELRINGAEQALDAIPTTARRTGQMNSIPFRAAVALLTFLIGIGVATAWVYDTRNPKIDPIPLNSKDESTLEMVFVLDTTGSMGGLLEGAKQRIWGIVNEVMQSSQKTNVRIGL